MGTVATLLAAQHTGTHWTPLEQLDTTARQSINGAVGQLLEDLSPVPDLLEIPAGRLDKPGEEPLPAAQRELAEEIGKGADHWEPILTYYTGAGFTDEQVHLFAATGLHDESADSGEEERIDVGGVS